MGSGENLLLKPMVYSVPEVDRGGIVRKGVSFPSLWDLGEVITARFCCPMLYRECAQVETGVEGMGRPFFFSVKRRKTS